MADYVVNAWRLSDFSGGVFDSDFSALDRSNWAGVSNAKLSVSASVASFFLTDEPTGHAAQNGLSVLTEQVQIGDTVVLSGQQLNVEYILTTGSTPNEKLVIGCICDETGKKTDERLVFSSNELRPGQDVIVNGVSEAPTAPEHTICFAKGTMIETPHGDVPVEELMSGDLVVSRDGGVVPVEWAGNRTFTSFELALHPHLRPIRIKKDALGPNNPSADLVVSPQHRVLISDWRAEYFFGEEEVLVPARALLNDHSVLVDRLQTGVDYYHVLLQDHDLLSANGQWAESLFPSAEALETLTAAQQEELEYLIPGFFDEIAEGYTPSRPTVHHEVGTTLAS